MDGLNSTRTDHPVPTIVLRPIHRIDNESDISLSTPILRSSSPTTDHALEQPHTSGLTAVTSSRVAPGFAVSHTRPSSSSESSVPLSLSPHLDPSFNSKLAESTQSPGVLVDLSRLTPELTNLISLTSSNTKSVSSQTKTRLDDSFLTSFDIQSKSVLHYSLKHSELVRTSHQSVQFHGSYSIGSVDDSGADTSLIDKFDAKTELPFKSSAEEKSKEITYSASVQDQSDRSGTISFVESSAIFTSVFNSETNSIAANTEDIINSYSSSSNVVPNSEHLIRPTSSYPDKSSLVNGTLTIVLDSLDISHSSHESNFPTSINAYSIKSELSKINLSSTENSQDQSLLVDNTRVNSPHSLATHRTSQEFTTSSSIGVHTTIISKSQTKVISTSNFPSNSNSKDVTVATEQYSPTLSHDLSTSVTRDHSENLVDASLAFSRAYATKVFADPVRPFSSILKDLESSSIEFSTTQSESHVFTPSSLVDEDSTFSSNFNEVLSSPVEPILEDHESASIPIQSPKSVDVLESSIPHNTQSSEETSTFNDSTTSLTSQIKSSISTSSKSNDTEHLRTVQMKTDLTPTPVSSTDSPDIDQRSKMSSQSDNLFSDLVVTVIPSDAAADIATTQKDIPISETTLNVLHPSSGTMFSSSQSLAAADVSQSFSSLTETPSHNISPSSLSSLPLSPSSLSSLPLSPSPSWSTPIPSSEPSPSIQITASLSPPAPPTSSTSGSSSATVTPPIIINADTINLSSLISTQSLPFISTPTHKPNSPSLTSTLHQPHQDPSLISKSPSHHTSDISIPMVTSTTRTDMSPGAGNNTTFTTTVAGKVDSSSDDGFMSGSGSIIIGSACGVFAVGIVVIIALLCAMRRRSKKKSKTRDPAGDELWVDMNGRDNRYRLSSPSLMTLPTLEDEQPPLEGKENMCYKALHDYTALQEGHLTLTKGDEVQLLETADNGWCRGISKKDGMAGWFPNSYVTEAYSIENEGDFKDTDSKTALGHISSFQIKKNDSEKMPPAIFENIPTYPSLERKGGNPDVACWVKMAASASMSSIPSADSAANDYNSPNKGIHFRAIYAYKPVCKGEMGLKEGELVVCKEKDKNGWMLGLKPQTKEEGWFPAVYVDEVSNEADLLSDSDMPATYEILESNKLHNISQPWTGIEHKTNSDYVSEVPGDLNFECGEVIYVYQTLANGWWFGSIEDKSGWFPGSFVEMTPKEGSEGLVQTADQNDEHTKQAENVCPSSPSTSSVHTLPSLDEMKLVLRAKTSPSVGSNPNSASTSAVNSPRESVASSIYSENDKLPLMSHKHPGDNKHSNKIIRPNRKAPAPPVLALKSKLAVDQNGTNSLRRPARHAPAPPSAQKLEKVMNNNNNNSNTNSNSDLAQNENPGKVPKKPVVLINGKVPKLIKTLPSTFDDKCLNPMIRPAKRAFAPTPDKHHNDRKQRNKNVTPTPTVHIENDMNSPNSDYSPTHSNTAKDNLSISKKSYIDNHIRNNSSPTSSLDSGMDVKMQRPYTPTNPTPLARSFNEFDRLTTPERESNIMSINRSRSNTPTAFHRLTPRQSKTPNSVSPYSVPSNNGYFTSLASDASSDKASDVQSHDHDDPDSTLDTTLTHENIENDDTSSPKSLVSTFLSPNNAQPHYRSPKSILLQYKKLQDNKLDTHHSFSKSPTITDENDDSSEIQIRKTSFSRLTNNDNPPTRDSLNLAPGTVNGMVQQINSKSPSIPPLNKSLENIGSFLSPKESPATTPSVNTNNCNRDVHDVERLSPELPPLQNDTLPENTFRPISANDNHNVAVNQNKPDTESSSQGTELDNYKSNSQNDSTFNSEEYSSILPSFNGLTEEKTTAL